jgi:hypothetical protein
MAMAVSSAVAPSNCENAPGRFPGPRWRAFERGSADVGFAMRSAPATQSDGIGCCARRAAGSKVRRQMWREGSRVGR